MLHIEQVRMRLPAGFEHRAETIARSVAELMVAFEARDNRGLDKLVVGPVRVTPGSTDQEIARTIAQRIISALGDGA